MGFIKKNTSKILIFLAIAYPVVYSLSKIYFGIFPFWGDPARDLLLGLANIDKPTLIGPTSGIPGIYYGPYWIWLISIGQLTSKDPRLTLLIVGVIPYFIIFPFILYKFSYVLKKNVWVIIWLMFIISFNTYTFYIWNPHLAPVIFLVLTYLILKIPRTSEVKSRIFITFITGLTSGVLLNFHISFGLGILIASTIYLVAIELMLNKTKRFISKVLNIIKLLITFTIGTLITFTPQLIFELRHDFIQTRRIYSTLYDTFILKSSSVVVSGFSKELILEHLYIAPLNKLTNIPEQGIVLVFLFSIIGFVYLLSHKKLKLNKNEINLLLFCAISLISIMVLYLSSKNPVWNYHFVGVEIIFLLLIGLIISKISYIKYLATIYVTILILLSFPSFYSDFATKNQYLIDTFASKKLITENIIEDANGQNYTVYAYNEALFSYDYEYLFDWLGNGNYNKEGENLDTVYVILPDQETGETLDYVNYKTPNDDYKTESIVIAKDRTRILKRIKH